MCSLAHDNPCVLSAEEPDSTVTMNGWHPDKVLPFCSASAGPPAVPSDCVPTDMDHHHAHMARAFRGGLLSSWKRLAGAPSSPPPSSMYSSSPRAGGLLRLLGRSWGWPGASLRALLGDWTVCGRWPPACKPATHPVHHTGVTHCAQECGSAVCDAGCQPASQPYILCIILETLPVLKSVAVLSVQVCRMEAELERAGQKVEEALEEVHAYLAAE